MVATLPQVEVPAETKRRPRRKRKEKRQARLFGAATGIVVVIAWQVVAWLHVVTVQALPGPIAIAQSFASYSHQGMWIDLRTSGEEFILGYLLGGSAGIVFGLVIGWYRYIGYCALPYISIFYSVPIIALAPLVIIWFGIGLWAKVSLVSLAVFLPTLVNTISGVRAVDSNLVELGRAFCCKDVLFFRRVVLPSCVPFTLTGLRLGVGSGLIGMFVGELVVAQHGIGLMMTEAGALFETARVFVGIVILAFVSVVLTQLLRSLERQFDSWRPQR